jgi:putative phosphoribosyl transferase
MPHPPSITNEQKSVLVPADSVKLIGDLSIPHVCMGAVLFAHGSGSSRFSPRNRFVAQFLQEAGLATLLIDLLTEDEEATDMLSGHLRFNTGLLARRLVAASHWLVGQEEMHGLKVGYFGASTGAAAALIAAAERPDAVHAVVSRGGRPDLAGDALPRVQAPTLLIVGADDYGVIELNREAYERLRCVKRVEMVHGATHLFEEAGALEEVARLARDWFRTYLT